MSYAVGVYRVLESDRVAGITRRCPDCGRPMKSLPALYWDGHRWFVAFHCTYDDTIAPVWHVDLQPLIEDVTRGVDVESLPPR